MNNIGVLISGKGSNLKALLASPLQLPIKCIISNKADAKGLSYATQYNIPHYVIDHQSYASREEFEIAISEKLNLHNCNIIALAGFMRILSPWIINKFHNKIVNIHPSILPAFIGTNTHQRAIASGVKLSGVTIHLVNNELDAGPILIQATTPILANDTVDSLKDRIHNLEHIIYPFVLNKIVKQQYTLENNIARIIRSIGDDKLLINNQYSNFYY